MASGEELRVGRRRFTLTRPDKMLFPDDGLTKADLVAYHRDVAPVLLVHLRDRPLMLQRCPDGVSGSCFYQKEASDHFPKWVRTVTAPKANGTVHHVVCNDEATLAYLAGQGCITFHPWLARADRLDRPDRVVFDFDPSGPDFDTVLDGARQGARLLEEVGLEPFVATTGSRGLHVVAPIQRRSGFDEAREFARRAAEVIAARDPRCFTLEARKDRRRGRVLVDVQRNAYAQTAVAPYSVRVRPGAPVAIPLAWSELGDRHLDPQRWHVADVRRRLDRRGDPWADLSHRARALGPARRRLDDVATEARAAV